MFTKSPSTRRWRPLRAFTLVELIVVVLVLGILAAVGVVGYSQFTVRANQAAAAAHTRDLVTAVTAQALVDGADVLDRALVQRALEEHFAVTVHAGQSAAATWDLLGVNEEPRDPEDLAVGFITSEGRISNDAGVSAVFVFVPGQPGTRPVAAVMSVDAEALPCQTLPGTGSVRDILMNADALGACAPANLHPLTAPAAPGDPTSAGPGPSLTVSWQATAPTDSAPVDGYRLFRLPAEQDAWDQASPVWTGTTTTVADDPGATDTTTWCYRVAAYGAGGQSPLSPVTCVEHPVAPDAPSQLAAGRTLTDVYALTWAAVAATERAPVTGYRIFRQPSGASVWDATSQIWEGTALTAADTPADADTTTWCYRVAAYGPGGQSALSARACVQPPAAPAAPTSVNVTRASSTFTLTWPAVTSTADAPVTGYRVLRQPLGSNVWTSVSQIWQGTALTYADTPGSTPSNTWVYRVAAYGPGGQTLSSPAYGAFATAPTAAPTAVTVTPGDGAVTLTWAAVPTANNGGASILDYQVTASPAPASGATARLVGSAGTSMTFTGLSNLTTYRFTVKAVNGAGTGPGTLSAPVVPAASLATFTKSGSWTAPAGVTSVIVTTAGGGVRGAAIVSRVTVVPGQTYYATVGYGAANSAGGAADLRSSGNTLADRIVVAGGAGGKGGGTGGGSGGDGGPVGGSGGAGSGVSPIGQYKAGGAGGTQTSGCQKGQGCSGQIINESNYVQGGGGGGGYWGGLGGQSGYNYSAGGGGGSSYAAPGVSVLTNLGGGNPSAGAWVSIAY